MAQNPSDKAALKALSHPDDKKLFEKALHVIKSPTVASAFQSVHQVFSAKANADQLPAHLEALVRSRMFLTAEFTFLKHQEQILTLDSDQCLACAASPKCINAWIGNGADAPAKREELLRRVEEAPEKLNSSALAAWFLNSSPPNSFKNALPLFASAAEEKSFTPIKDLLVTALRRDDTGRFLSDLLSSSVFDAGGMERIASLILESGTLIALAIERLPRACEVLQPAKAAAFTRALFSISVDVSDAAEKRLWSSRLLALAASVIGLPTYAAASSILAELDHIAEVIEDRSPSDKRDPHRCVIRYLGEQRGLNRPDVTERGARLLALTLAKISGGDDPALSVEAAAMNLGMTPLGNSNETLAFDPSIHEDLVGGLIRGDKVTVAQTGWMYGQKVIERSKVKPF